ncbi:Dinitrogenase iron-molybdenum cofactor [Draconibacterium orientale]|jgi:predicted Fe-Mo cluster-binding NifX family protein|uniref:Diguanylate cyclase n=1 Tax=Draconibacterium orientale TaxID=1168034 RepID=X5DG57_9BACT|nr:NifB/NifX family molybdenum-iron cluster-binding protein [Draconibacterium orientale]AHW60064.1 diguanylate cyclase [Draconibacterium orientale]SET63563.1 Dinitrogenase iron-molybdenum cofactor [Draconibacterium orientale]
MSKIFAITSSGKTEKSFLDLRFGKCEYIVLFDVEKNQYSIEENKFLNESHSGIKLVDFLKEQGVTTIVTGEVGPMVSERLEKEKLQLVLLHEERIRVDEIMDRIES